MCEIIDFKDARKKIILKRAKEASSKDIAKKLLFNPKYARMLKILTERNKCKF